MGAGKIMSLKKVEFQSKKYNHVLLIDDNEIDNIINERILMALNFSNKITLKNSAQAAIKFIELNLDEPELLPDIIFLDIYMPIMDGFGFLREFEQLKNQPISNYNPLIIPITSAINPDLPKRLSEEYGLSEFVNKPLNEKVINHLIGLKQI